MNKHQSEPPGCDTWRRWVRRSATLAGQDRAGQVLHVRLENAKLNPSVEMLQRVADALGAELEVSFVLSDKAHPAPAEQAQVVPALG